MDAAIGKDGKSPAKLDNNIANNNSQSRPLAFGARNLVDLLQFC